MTLAEAMKLAFAAHARGDLPAAEQLCRAVLDTKADHLDALHLAGAIALQTGRVAEAVDLLSRAVAADPNVARAFINFGLALAGASRWADAVASYDRALALDPGQADAHFNRGMALSRLRQHEAALASYDEALVRRPEYAEAYNNRGVVLADLRRYDEALASYRAALHLKPAFAEAWNNQGIAQAAGKQFQAAQESYAQAARLKPDSPEIHRNLGGAFGDLKRHADALRSYARALELKPGFEFLYGDWLHTKLQLCEWDGLAGDFAGLYERIERGEPAAAPLVVVGTPASLALQRRAAETCVRVKHAADGRLGAIAEWPPHERLRIGYFSADFREHPVSDLVVELFERHDRSRFHLTGFSFGPDTGDTMRARVAAALDRFVDVRDQSDEEVALLARALEIDIAIDLTGFTRDARPGIFALRAAPVQVNYLGYPGTMGAAYIDYLIADATVIPDAHRPHYAERIVLLPDSFQPHDTRRPVADRRFTRKELGLPRTGFVFCSFNNNHKFTPDTFDDWMRVLRAVDDSVLWLREYNAGVADALRREAERRGVAAGRLVFAPRMPQAEHLARHRAADIFLDTLPYNAHATASDALRAGLPVLTCLGETFAGRVGASLLHALGLPQLVAATREAYVERAIELAMDPAQLHWLRAKLAEARTTAPLFDIARYTRHIESAYAAMEARRRAQLPPDHIRVRP